MKILMNVHVSIFIAGENFFDFFMVFIDESIKMIRIDIRRAITPPSLLGIDRRIA